MSLNTEQLDALRTLAGWPPTFIDWNAGERTREQWVAHRGRTLDHAPDWQTIRADLAAALEADAIAPLGKRGKVRGAVLEVLRDAVGDPSVYLHPQHKDWNRHNELAGWGLWTLAGADSLAYSDTINNTLLAALDHLEQAP